MDARLVEERLRMWREAEAEVRERLSAERGITADLDIQGAVQALRRLDVADPSLLLREEWTAEKLYKEVVGVDFAAWLDFETIELETSILPSSVPTQLEEERVKFQSEIWHVHRYDPDPFPSSPHAHNEAQGIKLDLRNGRLYRRSRHIGELPRKDLLRFRGLVKRVELPALEV